MKAEVSDRKTASNESADDLYDLKPGSIVEVVGFVGTGRGTYAVVVHPDGKRFVEVLLWMLDP